MKHHNKNFDHLAVQFKTILSCGDFASDLRSRGKGIEQFLSQNKTTLALTFGRNLNIATDL